MQSNIWTEKKAIKVVYERYIRITFVSLITLFLNYTVLGKKHKQLIMVDYTHFVFGQQWQGAKKFTFPLCLSVIICDIFCFCDFYNMLQ